MSDHDCGHDFHHHFYYDGDSGGGGGDGSGVKAFLCVIGGFLLMVLLFMGLEVETDSVPAILLIIIWFVFAGGLAALFIRR